jgi:hypothetical protein
VAISLPSIRSDSRRLIMFGVASKSCRHPLWSTWGQLAAGRASECPFGFHEAALAEPLSQFNKQHGRDGSTRLDGSLVALGFFSQHAKTNLIDGS